MRLNLLPVSFPFHEEEVTYSFARTDALNEKLREQSGHVQAFHTYNAGVHRVLQALCKPRREKKELQAAELPGYELAADGRVERSVADA